MTLCLDILTDYAMLGFIENSGLNPLYLARHKITGLTVAIREYSREDPDAMRDFEHESAYLRNIFHPFIIGLVEIIEMPMCFYLVVEWPESGSLMDIVNKWGPISEPAAKAILMQILCAFEYLHYARRTPFFNLTLENVRLDQHQHIRIGNFAIPKKYDSVVYSAPEVLLNQSLAETSDIWTIGVLLFVLTVGHFPFHDSNQGRLLQKIVGEDPIFPVSISPMFSDLLHRLLAKDPSLRLSLKGIKQHPWILSTIAFDFAAIDRLRISLDPIIATSLDPDIEAELEALGLSVVDLKGAFLQEQQTLATVSYSMRLRQKMADELNEILRPPHYLQSERLISFTNRLGRCQAPPNLLSSVSVRYRARTPSCITSALPVCRISKSNSTGSPADPNRQAYSVFRYF
jgi:serine/threonine protein kinase